MFARLASAAVLDILLGPFTNSELSCSFVLPDPLSAPQAKEMRRGINKISVHEREKTGGPIEIAEADAAASLCAPRRAEIFMKMISPTIIL